MGDALSMLIASVVLLGFRWASPSEELRHPLAAGPQVVSLCISDFFLGFIDFIQSCMFLINNLDCDVQGSAYDILHPLCEASTTPTTSRTHRSSHRKSHHWPAPRSPQTPPLISGFSCGPPAW